MKNELARTEQLEMSLSQEILRISPETIRGYLIEFTVRGQHVQTFSAKGYNHMALAFGISIVEETVEKVDAGYQATVIAENKATGERRIGYSDIETNAGGKNPRQRAATKARRNAIRELIPAHTLEKLAASAGAQHYVINPDEEETNGMG